MDGSDAEFIAINKILDEVNDRMSVVSKTLEEVEIETKLLSVEIDNAFDKWGGNVWVT